MSSKHQNIIIFALGVMVGLLSWSIVSLAQPQNAMADATGGGVGGSSDGIIAVTGAVTNSFSGLWVLDARDTATSPSLALYVPGSSGRSIQLAAARRIKYDLQLVALNDRSKQKVGALRAQIEKLNQEELGKK